MYYILEAGLIGLFVAAIGILVWLVISLFFNFSAINGYNFIITFSILFISGFLVHVIAENVGINKSYCTKGAACKKLAASNSSTTFVSAASSSK
jgi:low affinity Fe/Cu permease